MAVKEGFEPSIRDKPYTPLAGERLQPLGHLTVFVPIYDLARSRGFEPLTAWFVARYSIQLSYERALYRKTMFARMAVKEGFEPSIRDKPYTPLAGERLQPLGHLTVLRRHILRFTKNKSNNFFEKIAPYRLTVAHLTKTHEK